MSRDTIPDWKDMPEPVSLVSVSWEDVFAAAYDELQRVPTQHEVIEMFDELSASMIHAAQDDFPDQLKSLIAEIVSECLKSNVYDIDTMSDAELTSKKYCHECQEVQGTYWELNHCEKNPKGVEWDSAINANHGNDETCEDGYCNPESTPIKNKDITLQYIKEHAVFERCVQCHQYFDSAGLQAEQDTTNCENACKESNDDSSACPHDVLDVNSCLICEKESQCNNCSGRGFSMGDTLTGTYEEIQCDECNSTGNI